MINWNQYGVKNGECIYKNALKSDQDIKSFVLEGSARITFPEGRMRMENAMSADQGQKANYVLWCPEDFPSDVYIQWKFWPIKEPGLCILFFSAAGRNGEDLFDPSLQARTGEYNLYHHGDINAYHVSYFRRKEADERAFHTCNLRKSYGFHLTAQGGDPIPDADEAASPYTLGVLKYQEQVRFFVNDMEVFCYLDDGRTYGPRLGGGKIGFRQLAPLVAEYADLEVYALHYGEDEKDARD